MKEFWEQEEEKDKSNKKLAEIEEKYYIDLQYSIKESMNSPHTRKFIREIFSWCMMYHTASLNEGVLAHAEGRRFIGVQLKNTLDQIDKEIYINLMQEGIRYEKALFDN